jgi:hypothetical protein
VIEVPEKKILVIPTKESEGYEPFNLEDLKTFLRPLNSSIKRDWFSADFYRCLPLSIGNMQGFVVSVPFDFSVSWNGGNSTEDLFFKLNEEADKISNKWTIGVNSHFGHGIFTIHIPVILKTPSGVNLMTIAPPNYPLPGLSPMTGVVESDNLRYTFTLNIKVDIPNVWIDIKKNFPLVGIIPIPRYFCDEFELIFDSENVSEEQLEEERQIVVDHDNVRGHLAPMNRYDGSYFAGYDIRGNNFQDHQMPKVKGREKVVKQ